VREIQREREGETMREILRERERENLYREIRNERLRIVRQREKDEERERGKR
jgi:hypothetical protein